LAAASVALQAVAALRAAAPVALQAVAALRAAALAAELAAEAGTAPDCPSHRGAGTPAQLGGVGPSSQVLPESWWLLAAGC